MTILVTLSDYERAVAFFEDGARVRVLRESWSVEISLRPLRFWQIDRMILIRRMRIILTRITPAAVQLTITHHTKEN